MEDLLVAVRRRIKARLIMGLSHVVICGPGSDFCSLIMSSSHLKSLYAFLHINNDSKSSLEAISDEQPTREIGKSFSLHDLIMLADWFQSNRKQSFWLFEDRKFFKLSEII